MRTITKPAATCRYVCMRYGWVHEQFEVRRNAVIAEQQMLASHNAAYSCCNFSMLAYPAVLNAVTSCTSAASRVTVLDPLAIARGFVRGLYECSHVALCLAGRSHAICARAPIARNARALSASWFQLLRAWNSGMLLSRAVSNALHRLVLTGECVLQNIMWILLKVIVI